VLIEKERKSKIKNQTKHNSESEWYLTSEDDIAGVLHLRKEVTHLTREVERAKAWVIVGEADIITKLIHQLLEVAEFCVSLPFEKERVVRDDAMLVWKVAQYLHNVVSDTRQKNTQRNVPLF